MEYFFGRAGRDASLSAFRQLRDTISEIVSQSVARQAAPECDTISKASPQLEIETGSLRTAWQFERGPGLSPRLPFNGYTSNVSRTFCEAGSLRTAKRRGRVSRNLSGAGCERRMVQFDVLFNTLLSS